MGLITISRPVGSGLVTPPGGSIVDESVAQAVSLSGSVFEDVVAQSVQPLLYDNFSQYATRAELLDFNAAQNPWTAMNQNEAFNPGEFIYLDTAPPAGGPGASKTMRYDHGFVTDCANNVLDTGGGARRLISGNPTELWLDFHIYLVNWTSTACGFFAYKLAFFDANPSGRTDINWVGEGMQASLGGGSSNIFTGGSTAKPTFADFVNTWTRIRMHAKLASNPGTTSDAQFELWIDNERVYSQNNLPCTLTSYTQLRLGANLNNMTFNDMKTHWAEVSLYDQNPGWS